MIFSRLIINAQFSNDVGRPLCRDTTYCLGHGFNPLNKLKRAKPLVGSPARLVAIYGAELLLHSKWFFRFLPPFRGVRGPRWQRPKTPLPTRKTSNCGENPPDFDATQTKNFRNASLPSSRKFFSVYAPSKNMGKWMGDVCAV